MVIAEACLGEQDSGFNNSRNAIAILNQFDIDVRIFPIGQLLVFNIFKIFEGIGTVLESLDSLSLANLDRTDEARNALADAVNAKPDLTIAFLKENMPTKDENGLEPYLAGLRKAGLAES